MSAAEFRFRVGGSIPVLKVHHEPRPGPAVVVLHGLGASAEQQLGELHSLAGAGFAAVAVDAPHHGARRDAWLDTMTSLDDGPSHERFLRLLVEAIGEVSRVIDHLQAEGHGPISVLGISMGAYTALGAARAEQRLAACVSILGTPDWAPARGQPTDGALLLMREAPVHQPQALTRAPLLLLNAGLDVPVPPGAARAFAAAHPHNTEYVEYPESDHLMRHEDWAALWERVLGFLDRHGR